MRRIFLFILVATLLLTPLDYLQVLAGVRTLGIAYWLTPIGFAIVGGLLGLFSFWLDPKPHPAGIKAVLLHGFFFAIAYLSTIVLNSPYDIVSALILDILIQNTISKYLFRIPTFEVIPFWLSLAVVGPILEWIQIKIGIFSYPSMPGQVPFWLPFLWGSGVYFARSLVGRERNIKEK